LRDTWKSCSFYLERYLKILKSVSWEIHENPEVCILRDIWKSWNFYLERYLKILKFLSWEIPENPEVFILRDTWKSWSLYLERYLKILKFVSWEISENPKLYGGQLRFVLRKERGVFSAPLGPDRFWGPPSLLSDGCHRLFLND
jgi:hypothetical protein